VEPITIQKLRENPSAVFESIESGQVLIITREDGTPISTVQPVSELPRKQFIPETYKGKIWIADDFDAPMEIVDAQEVR